MTSDGPAAMQTPKQMATRFQPGQSGNPEGSRAKCRYKLSEAFIRQLLLDFEAHGDEAIITVRQRRPQDYLRIIASLIPRQERDEGDERFIIGTVVFPRGYVDGTAEDGFPGSGPGGQSEDPEKLLLP